MKAEAIEWLDDAPPDVARKFGTVRYHGAVWDLSHLDAFAFIADVGCQLTVVVHFSCHCFSHSLRRDGRPRHLIPEHELYRDEREERVLNPQRYRLSRLLLRRVIRELAALPDGGLTARQRTARRVKLDTLLKAVYEGRPIRA